MPGTHRTGWRSRLSDAKYGSCQSHMRNIAPPHHLLAKLGRAHVWRACVLIPFVFGVITCSSRASAQAAPNRCSAAEALLKGGETEEARKVYVALLKRDPTLTCAVDGLMRIHAPQPTPTAPSCSSADAEFDAGDLNAARNEYMRVGESVECAAMGLAAIREVQRLCDGGGAYVASHRQDDALAAFKAALEKNPHAKCATDGLDKVKPWWLQRVSDSVTSALPELLVAIGLILLAFLVVLLAAYWKKVDRRLSRWPLIGRVLRPRLTLTALDDAALTSKVGASMAARIKERLQRFRDVALGDASDPESPGYDLEFDRADEEFADLVSGNSSLERSLDKLSGVSDQTKLVGGLASLLYTILPIKKLTVSGVLDSPESSAAAITLALEDNERQAAAVALSGPPLPGQPTATDYLRLADPAAVWIQYVVARAVARDRIDPDGAASYALVRKGLDLQLAGDVIQARLAYQQALDRNPRNWAGKVNLAILEASIVEDPEEANVIITTVLDEMRMM
jgi:tetratricopeptide (TPR) repeat protein